MHEKPVFVAVAEERLDGIQVLRAVAALLVVFHHSVLEGVHFYGLSGEGGAYRLISGGQAGVDLFFVISGFVIAYVYSRKSPSPQVFLAQRMARVIPVYWFYTTLAILVAVLLAQHKRNTSLGLEYIASSYFFFPVARLPDGLVQPVLGVGWTLNYEMFFYLLFGLGMSVFRGPRVLYFIVCLLCLWVLLGSVLKFDVVALRFWSSPLVLEFVFGILLATFYLRGVRLGRSVCLLTLLASVSMWAGLSVSGGVATYGRVLSWGLPAAGVFAAVLLCAQPLFSRFEGRLMDMLRLMGDASYSLYLVHMFVVRIVTMLLSRLFPGADSPLFIVAAILSMVVLSVGASVVSYRLIEIPATRYAKRQIDRFF